MRLGAPGRRLSLLLLSLLLLASLVVGMWIALDHPTGATLTYEQFLGEVRAGRVDAVLQRGSSLTVSIGKEQARVTTPSGVDVAAKVTEALGPRPAKAVGPGVYAGGIDVGTLAVGLLPLLLVVGLVIWVRAARSRERAGGPS